jgi:hypothetical protein
LLRVCRVTARCLCGLGDRQAERLYAIVPHRKAGVRRVFHRHRYRHVAQTREKPKHAEQQAADESAD